MTLLAVYYRRYYDDLYVLADSRLSAGATELSNSFPKLMLVPVHVFSRINGNKTYSGSIGVGFTGSALSATSTVLALQKCLSEIVSFDSSIPTMEEIASLTIQLLEIQTRQIGSATGSTSLAHLLLFGRMGEADKYHVFHLQPYVEDTGIHVRKLEWEMYDQHIKAIGSGAASYLAEIERQRDVQRYADATGALRQMISDDVRPDVGGSLQTARAVGNEVILPFELTEKPLDGEPRKFKYLGLDENTIGRLGNCGLGWNFNYSGDLSESPIDQFPR